MITESRLMTIERKDMERKRDEKGRYISSHGETKTQLHNVWCAMKERCGNPNNKSYKHYGARGISVCEEWQEYEPFRNWCRENGYKEGLTIDRIDTNGNYCPENCRWVDHKTQNRNYSRNHNITYKGETKCLADWADELGINRSTMLLRIKRGKTLDEVFSTVDGRTTRWKKKTTLNSCTQ